MLKPFADPIYVTRPYLPPIDTFISGLNDIWENRWLTNNGPVLDRFSSNLSDYFKTDNLCLFNNGTLALQIALQGMGISGEVITTPFTFVATTHVLYWNKIRPVFVDIHPDTYTIDPRKVEKAITPWTSAILAVHVYGHPCDHQALQDIADKHNLFLIYDAAHSFGVKMENQSIGKLGDLSMFSFHATKLFHSLEGGLLVFRNNRFKEIFDYLKNFGFKNETEVVMPGTNAKMNEFQALMGLSVLSHIDEIIDKREILYNHYRDSLNNIPGITLRYNIPHNVSYNYSYVPIEIDSHKYGMSRDEIYELLKTFNVYSRRYFYPLICDYSCYRGLSVHDPLTIARSVSDRILTLPIYHDLTITEVDKICEIIRMHSC